MTYALGKVILGVAVVCMLSSPAALAEPEPARRLCKPDDIVGTWYMVNLKANFAYDQTNPWYFKYQILAFGTDGSFKHWTSGKPPTDLDRAVVQSMNKTQTYTLDSTNGHLVTTHTDTKQSTYYSCVIYTQDSGENKKGDVWLGTGEPTGSLIIKVLEKEEVVMNKDKANESN